MNGRRRSAAALRAVTATVLLAGVTTGCHHHARSAGQPAPPSTNSGSGAGNVDGRVVGDGERTGVASGAPPRGSGIGSSGTGSGVLPSLELHGAPFATEVGLASWYGPPYAGRKGADGAVYDQNALTAAHLTLALGTVVRVTNLVNGQSVVVRITDRGPFVRGRIIDLSLAAAKATGVYRAGVVRVRVEAFNAPPPRPNSYPGGRWCVQVGAFPTEADAVQEKLELAGRYPDAKVIEFSGPTGYWVRINPKIADRAHAAEVEARIHLPDEAQPYLVRTD